MEGNDFICNQIAIEINIKREQVNKTMQLLDDGNTVPFIARYRKEMTGELNEEQVRQIEDRLQYLRSLSKRKNEVVRLIDEQGKLTKEIEKKILNATKLTEIEDLYRPFRPKRRTRASIAREKGLEPLASYLLSDTLSGNIEEEAVKYLNEEKEVNSIIDAINGAADIIAETVADDPQMRSWLRNFTLKTGVLSTRAKEKKNKSVYEMYYDYTEPVRYIVPHRILAINRGEREGILRVHIGVDEEAVLKHINKHWVKQKSVSENIVSEAIKDGYRRLLAPAIERDIRTFLTEKAEEQALKVFSKNLRNLLMQPPVVGKTVLGVDPGYRTGCKWAVVDETSKLLEVGVVYPTPPHEKIQHAKDVFRDLVNRYDINVIAIGNGTASRETEKFVADFINTIEGKSINYVIVSEAGASVYSASQIAAREFPELDVAERSAVSIARRLQDPLAELVKIEPRAVGVGQYQHDIASKKLEESLGKVVESTVNFVGVDLNTASAELLRYVSGINSQVAENIVSYRNEKGKFKNRKALSSVPRLGPKAFEQAAGFLRIKESNHPLDNTAIHPESYTVACKFLELLGCSLADLGTEGLRQKLKETNVEKMAGLLDTGVPTLRDIIDNLSKPGRDPREDLPPPLFRSDVLSLEDLRQGMQLKGTVRNVVDFGAFVDIGVKVDGLVHISQMSGNRYIKHPMDIVSVGDVVTVKVISLDIEKQRIGLSMLTDE